MMKLWSEEQNLVIGWIELNLNECKTFLVLAISLQMDQIVYIFHM